MGVRPVRRPLLNARHALGHTEIDKDHFAIADSWLAAMNCRPLSLPFHVARMRKLTRRHFAREVMLLEAARRPFCPCHRREHDTMLAMCDEIYALSEKDVRAARSLLRKLSVIMREHVIGMDQIAVLMINTSANSPVLPVQR